MNFLYSKSNNLNLNEKKKKFRRAGSDEQKAMNKKNWYQKMIGSHHSSECNEMAVKITLNPQFFVTKLCFDQLIKV